ncbi:CFEM domain-containing protein [Lasiosphaeria hispida]|uniref:CFEM domain-containing protein n=1 Tax=Lasiosphaeria hispida TaxID=260671 RepID=A0AAJ0H8Q5_9PEZI|nr:CFEM domain-containing protein [Lasiosphaeria hispida]
MSLGTLMPSMRAAQATAAVFFSLLLVLPPTTLAQGPKQTENFIQNITSGIPECGVDCILQFSPAVNSSCTGDGTDTTCLCGYDTQYYTDVLNCVQARCTIEESIETARGAWEACGRPQRSRKADLLAPLSIEIPALLCVFLRLFSRWWTVSRFEVDDYIMMLVALLYIVFESLGSIAAQIAFGVDIWTVKGANLTLSLKLFYIGETMYLTILTLTKLSILWFYLRIFPNVMFRSTAYVVMAWVSLSGVIFVILQIFQCVPIPFIWEGWKKGDFGPYRCFDINALGFTSAAFSIAQDIVIIIMPLPLLTKLHVSRRSKLGIIFMFSLGIFVTITSCVRLWTLYTFGDSVNPTWDYTNALIWTGLEVAVSIIVTSLPAIRVLINRCSLGLFGSLSGSRRRRGYSSNSSFGNDTFVASWYSAPPALKRISEISRISSIAVGRIGGSSSNDDAGRKESQTELSDKLPGVPGGERRSCPPNFPSEHVGASAGRRAISTLPNFGDVLSSGRGTMSLQQQQQQQQQQSQISGHTHPETTATAADTAELTGPERC